MANVILIKDGKVVNTIIADESFIELIKDDYDAIIDHDKHPQNVAPDDFAIEEEDGSWRFVQNEIHFGVSITPINVESIQVEQTSIEAPTKALTEGEDI